MDQETKDYLNAKLDNPTLNSGVLLSGAKLLDENIKTNPLWMDQRHFPFYYYLGTHVRPKSVMQIGPTLGLYAMCFLQGCKTVEKYRVYEGDTFRLETQNLPKKMIEDNIRRYYSGHLEVGHMAEFKPEGKTWDLAMITEGVSLPDMKVYLETLWNGLPSDGLLVVGWIHNDDSRAVFDNFCRVKNREPDVFETRYRTGIIKR